MSEAEGASEARRRMRVRRGGGCGKRRGGGGEWGAASHLWKVRRLRERVREVLARLAGAARELGRVEVRLARATHRRARHLAVATQRRPHALLRLERGRRRQLLQIILELAPRTQQHAQRMHHLRVGARRAQLADEGAAQARRLEAPEAALDRRLGREEALARRHQEVVDPCARASARGG